MSEQEVSNPNSEKKAPLVSRLWKRVRSNLIHKSEPQVAKPISELKPASETKPQPDSRPSRRDFLKLTAKAAAITGVTAAGGTAAAILMGNRSNGLNDFEGVNNFLETEANPNLEVLSRLTAASPFQEPQALQLTYSALFEKSNSELVRSAASLWYYKLHTNFIYPDMTREDYRQSEYQIYLGNKNPGLEIRQPKNLKELMKFMTFQVNTFEASVREPRLEDIRLDLDAFSVNEFMHQNPEIEALYQDFITAANKALNDQVAENIAELSQKIDPDSRNLLAELNQVGTTALIPDLLMVKVVVEFPETGQARARVDFSETNFRTAYLGDEYNFIPEPQPGEPHFKSFWGDRLHLNAPETLVPVTAAWEAFTAKLSQALETKALENLAT